jgi:hypothetical protein
VKIDTTPPAVSFAGNAGSYTVDQTVPITCSVSDALSGVASTTCTDTNAPAWSFGLGATSLSASATDRVGNSASGTTTFSVTVTSPALDDLISQFFGNDADGAHADGAHGLIAKAGSVASAPTEQAKNGTLRARQRGGDQDRQPTKS